jgi:cobalamin biosynthesis protein CobW
MVAVCKLRPQIHCSPGAPRRYRPSQFPRLNAWFDRPWRDGEARRTDLVVIGMKGLDRPAIEAALRG